MSESWKCNIRCVTAIGLLVLSSPIVSAQTSARKQSNVELRIRPSQLINGVPDTISFVFVNITDHEVSIPPVSPCIGRYSGIVSLRLEFSPVGPRTAGKGGGCGGAVSHLAGILEEVKSWKRLQPGESLTVSYQRSELFVFEEAPGAYEFWGQYQPPHLTAEEMTALEHAGIDSPREPLCSTHLRFNRLE